MRRGQIHGEKLFTPADWETESGASRGELQHMDAPGFSFEMSYCGLPPVPADLAARWNTDPALILGLLAIAALGWWQLRGSGTLRRGAFAGGWALAAVLFVSPLCALTVSLFSARVAHHVLLTMGVAPLLALALPRATLPRFHLLPPLAVSTAALWLWHYPELYAAAFVHPAVYWGMQLSLLGSFTWLWLGLIRNPEPMPAAVAALTSAIQMGLLGALLVFAPQPLYEPSMATTAAFGLLPLEDQQLGGLIMWVPANLPLLAVVLWRLIGMLQEREMATR